MRHARHRVVRRVTRLAAVGGLLLGAAMVTTAMASETPGGTSATAVPFAAPPDATGGTGPDAPGTGPDAPGTGAGLVTRLGTARTAGSWLDAGGRPVVAVTDERAARTVREAGAEAKLVPHSMNELRSATAALRSAPRVAGTAWALDYRTNQVVVRADRTVSAGDWSRLTRIAAGIGGFVRMERTEGTFTTRLNGAQPMLSTGGRCSAGFNVTDGQSDYILTAGHCGPKGTDWFTGDGAGRLGTTVATDFPGSDFSLVRYASGFAGAGAGVVAVGGGKGIRITAEGEAAVGQRVFRSGSTSGLHDGTVTGLDATVNYPEGTVTGLVQTDVCAEPGDSGGPLFSEGIALGVTSGGSGDCTTGGTTFFQPVSKALSALGVRLLVSPRDSGAGAGASPSPAPAASATRGAVAPGTPSSGPASPGAATAATGTARNTTLTDRLTDGRTVGPGLLVLAGSLIALVASRYIRSERERKEYQRRYSATWG